MDRKYFEYIATIKGLTTYHYKVLLTLNALPRCQKDVSKVVGLSPQNTSRVFKKLLNLGLIELVANNDHRIKVYRAITSLSRLGDKKDNEVLEGQIKLI